MHGCAKGSQGTGCIYPSDTHGQRSHAQKKKTLHEVRGFTVNFSKDHSVTTVCEGYCASLQLAIVSKIQKYLLINTAESKSRSSLSNLLPRGKSRRVPDIPLCGLTEGAGPQRWTAVRRMQWMKWCETGSLWSERQERTKSGCWGERGQRNQHLCFHRGHTSLFRESDSFIVSKLK